MRLNQKIALVTGSAGGIGSATARRFAREGATVILADRDFDGCRRVLDGIVAEGGAGTAHAADLTDETQVVALFSAIREKYGRLDILVNVAGGDAEPSATVEGIDVELMSRNFDMNLKSCILCCREATKIMKPQAYGRIVNMSSLVYRGSPGQFSYAASKGGIFSFTRSIAMALGASSITANALAPAIIGVEAFPRALGEERWKAMAEATAARYPLGRIGTPEDVASAALFLASDEASFITGQVLEISGGARL
ncbi:MAG: SDR family oxidoreductase [Chlorobiaceae bacterium]|nr:SDR family oxidoreductase [Chlorobiaceae bacterium]